MTSKYLMLFNVHVFGLGSNISQIPSVSCNGRVHWHTEEGIDSFRTSLGDETLIITLGTLLVSEVLVVCVYRDVFGLPCLQKCVEKFVW